MGRISPDTPQLVSQPLFSKSMSAKPFPQIPSYFIYEKSPRHDTYGHGFGRGDRHAGVCPARH
jgi:hypothetical protein